MALDLYLPNVGKQLLGQMEFRLTFFKWFKSPSMWMCHGLQFSALEEVLGCFGVSAYEGVLLGENPRLVA